MKPEKILTPSDDRFVLYPLQYPDIFEVYKKMLNSLWTVAEVDLEKDKEEFKKLTENEQHFIKYVLAFFAGSDGIVNENLCLRFFKDVQIAEARQAYGVQILIEAVHAHMYSELIETIVDNEAEKNHLFQAIKTIPCVKRKAEWALAHIESSSEFAERLLAFVCVEGIFFSGSFCSIFWLKEKKLMPGLITSNELISRDEGMHTDFGVLLYSKLENKLPKETVYKIFKEAVSIEKEFVTDALPVSLIGMNSTKMCEYIEFVADRLLAQLGYPKIWNARNPFPFMELMSLERQTNFFEHRATEYALVDFSKKEEKAISFSAEF